MIILKLFTTFFILGRAVCNNEKISKRNEGIFTYHRPQGNENYENIPVVVVYDSDSVREEKSIDINENKPTTDVPIEVPITTEAPIEISEHKKHKIVNYNQLVQLEQHIPVAVVYDPQNENQFRPNNNLPKGLPNNPGKLLKRVAKHRRQRKKKPTEILLQQINEEDKVTTSIYKGVSKEPDSSTSKQNIYFTDKIVHDENSGKNIRQRLPVVPIINMENVVYSHKGDFHYSYEGGDGTKAFSRGELKFIDDQMGEAVVGGFSYKDKDGNNFNLSYTADENGYQPVGDHLPTPPPIPPAIARALRYLATKPTPETITDSSIIN